MRGMEIKERKDNFTFSFYAFLGFSAVQLQMRKREKHGERRRREQWSEKKMLTLRRAHTWACTLAQILNTKWKKP